MSKARRAAERGELTGFYSRLLQPAPIGRACGVGVVVGFGLGLLVFWLTPQMVPGGGVTLASQPVLVRVLVGAVAGVAAGFAAGAVVAVLRNVLVGAYLRFVWSRYQHHVANDVLDKMS